MGVETDGLIRSSMPWAHAPKIDPKKYEQNRKHASEGLHYRGWTLVECGHYRYAVSDENANRRVRVCRARMETKKAIKAFRAPWTQRRTDADKRIPWRKEAGVPRERKPHTLREPKQRRLWHAADNVR